MMKQRIAAFLLLVVAMVGLGAAPAMAASSDQVCHTFVADDNTIESQTCVPAAQRKAELARWGYCNFTAPASKLTSTDLQGWCGSTVSMNAPYSGCRHMGQWDNWAGAWWNMTGSGIVGWNAGNCTGTPFKTQWSGPNVGGDPNLYDDNLGNAISSISLA